MIGGDEISALSTRLRDGIANAYGFKAASLKEAARRAGRRLPQDVQRQVARVVEAEQLGGHPKLLRLIDGAELAHAEKFVERHLTSVDRGAMRRTAAMNWLAQVSMYVFVVFGGVLLWAILTGRV